ncbi:MAG TPA: extracellular solute-binding protein [Methylomirabilota bacterium]|jgi:raffinose/stachyose/melibiose transport system substrate-binding protein
MSTPPISRRTILRLAGAGSLLAVGVGRAGAQARPGEPLRIWSNHPEWREALRKNLDAFEQQSGIKLTLEPKPGPEYVQVLSTSMQAGEGPDLPGIPPGPLVGQFLKSGAILDLTGRVHADRMIDIARQRVVRDGKVVGAPFGKYTVGVYYHVDLLAKAGLKPPRTWDELKRAAQTLKQAGVVPLMMPARDGVIPAFYYMLAASSVLGPVGFAGFLAGQRKLTDPDLVDAAQLLVDLAPYYPEGFAGISYAEGKATFARGGTAMILGGTADYAGYIAVNPGIKLDFIAFPPPSATAGVRATVSGLELIYTVNAKSKYVDAAVQFVDWLTTPESNRLFANSITLPTVKGVVPGQNPIWARQVEEAKNDVPTWRDVDAAAPVWTALTKSMQGVLLGQVKPAELGRQAQAALAGT